jgi:hypothetical protein
MGNVLAFQERISAALRNDKRKGNDGDSGYARMTTQSLRQNDDKRARANAGILRCAQNDSFYWLIEEDGSPSHDAHP